MPAVLKQWEKPSPMQHPPASHGRPLSTYGWDLPSLFRAVRCRWPDPIAATIQTGAPFHDLPRFPFQLWDFSRHAGRFLRRIPGLVAGRD
jgi:hypothetical protein